MIKPNEPRPSRQEISQVSLVQIARRYTDLKERGPRLVGLCPLHQERTPSFTIDSEKNLFHCFGCQAGGDVIRFVELVENVDFKGALRFLQLPLEHFRQSPRDRMIKRADAVIRTWSIRLSNAIARRLRETGQRIIFVDDQLRDLPYYHPVLIEERARLEEDWIHLEFLHEELAATPLDFWKHRESLESSLGVENAYSADELKTFFPPLTKDYKEYLNQIVGYGDDGRVAKPIGQPKR